MAECLRYVCGACGRAVEAWDDGNPYYLDRKGTKHYAYHPDHERLARCIGNDAPHLCPGCALEFVVDSRAPITACPRCASAEIADTYRLAGKPCPWCKQGTFAQDPDFFSIS